MNPSGVRKPSIGSARRQTVSVSSAELVTTSYLQPEQALPLVIQPATEEVDLISWATSQRAWVEAALLRHGGILFRNFSVATSAELEQFMTAIGGELLKYSYRSTPRSEVSGKIYTSTEYPADQTIPLHNEMAYSRVWPLKIAFMCIQAAEQGGETPIADSRKVFERIAPEVRECFIRKGVLYVRNYGVGVDLPWQTVFQMTDKADVEAYCRSAGIAFEWKDGDHLRTRQVCQATAVHPKTGESVWFNQAHLFHISSLRADIRDALLSSFTEDELPRHAYYGDGSPIEPEALDEIRAAYAQETLIFPWQSGDILLLDNMLVAHGRQPFSGPRKVIVGMAEPYDEQNTGHLGINLP